MERNPHVPTPYLPEPGDRRSSRVSAAGRRSPCRRRRHDRLGLPRPEGAGQAHGRPDRHRRRHGRAVQRRDLRRCRRRPVQHRHPRERHEVGGRGAAARQARLHPGRPARGLRQGPQAEGPRAHARLAQPAAGLAHRRGRGRQHHQGPGAHDPQAAHRDRDGPLQGRHLGVGRRERGVQRRRHAAGLAVAAAAGPGLHRRRVPLGAQGRPEGDPLLQRLQHRGHQRRRATPSTRWSRSCAARTCRSRRSGCRAT